MKFVVEIQGPNGGKAIKEYDGPTLRSVVRTVERELMNYPNCRLIDIWPQGEREEPSDDDTW
jgi:hypothetical protein